MKILGIFEFTATNLAATCVVGAIYVATILGILSVLGLEWHFFLILIVFVFSLFLAGVSLHLLWLFRTSARRQESYK